VWLRGGMENKEGTGVGGAEKGGGGVVGWDGGIWVKGEGRVEWRGGGAGMSGVVDAGRGGRGGKRRGSWREGEGRIGC